jgi:hypothetical protein
LKGKLQMMQKYEHMQKPGFPFWLTLAILVVNFSTLFIDHNILPLTFSVFVLLLWGLLMMSGLTVWIDEYFLRVRFGPGMFFKKFPLSQIVACEPKYKTHCLGWGIRYYFGGWLYNIAGFKSVEIIFKNGRKVRIGTDEPDKLAEAIRSIIRKTGESGHS